MNLFNKQKIYVCLIQKEKKESEKQRAEEKYKEWLENLKRKEREEKEKKLEEERRQKWKAEEEKMRRKEQIMLKKQSEKELLKVRPLSSRKGAAFVNGKLRDFYDWSTSPDPSFVNKEAWKS